MKLKFPLVISTVIAAAATFLNPILAYASESAGVASESAVEAHHFGLIFLAIAGILVAAKFLHLIEKIQLPPVVGELLAGIILGNLVLIGIPFFHDFRQHEIITFLAELGVVILLFQIGLESNVKQLVKVGATAMLVAFVGAFVPFLLGSYVVGPLLLPNQSLVTYLFLGASLAATSVGIAARIFKDLGMMKTKAAQIVLGAAVIDDILGLVILAVVSSLAVGGELTVVGIGLILAKSFLFLILSVVFGQTLAPWLSKLFAVVHTGMGSKFTLVISFGLLFAAIAEFVGLEPIIGAFAAGLVLDPVHFKNFKEPHLIEELKEKLKILPAKSRQSVELALKHHSDKHVEDLIEPLSLFFVPIFFVVTGMSVNILDLAQLSTIVTAIIITIVAVLGKIVAGYVAKGDSKLTIGLALVPRGEVGLIFAAIGQGLGVISSQVFSVIVLTVLLTTIVGPFLLSNHLRKA